MQPPRHFILMISLVLLILIGFPMAVRLVEFQGRGYSEIVRISTMGMDIPTCGRALPPCKSILYTISTVKPSNGSLIIMMDGEYFETNYTEIINTQYTLMGQGGNVYIHGSRSGLFRLSNGTKMEFINIKILNTTGYIPSQNSVETNDIQSMGLEDQNLNLTCAIHIDNSSASFQAVEFNDNQLYPNSSLIFMDHGIVEFCDCKVQRTHGMVAIFFKRSIVLFNNTIFLNNLLNRQIVTSLQSYVSFLGCTIAYNRTPYGIFLYKTFAKFKQCNVIGNLVQLGTIISYNGTMISVDRCRFIENVATKSGGVFTLSHENQSNVTISIFERNFAPASASFATFTRGLIISNCIFRGGTQATNQLALYSSSVTFIRDCVFKNITGTIISSDSSSLVTILYTKFSNIKGRVLQNYGKGEAVLASSKIINCAVPDTLFYCSNKAKLYMFECLIANNSATTIVISRYSSKVIFVNGLMYNNSVDLSILYGFNNYFMLIDNTRVYNNSGQTRGLLLEGDQTGALIVTNTHFYRNKASYGTFLFYRTPSKRNLDYLKSEYDRTQNVKCTHIHQCDLCGDYVTGPFCYYTYFQNNTMIDNSVIKAGALVYYENSQVLSTYKCVNCFTSNNVAIYGDVLNTFYYGIDVIMPTDIDTPETVQAIVVVLDAYGNVLKGRTDVNIFTEFIGCPNMTIKGVTTTGVNMAGLPIMYNLRIQGIPGSFCNLSFWTIPTLKNKPNGIYNVPINIATCKSGYIQYYNEEHENHCYKLKEIPHIEKLVLGVVSIVIIILLVICGIITFIKRHHVSIVYSNPFFLYIVLVGCIISLVSVFPSYMVSDVACRLRSLLSPLGAVIATTVVNVKQFRIWRIRGELQHHQWNKRIIETSYLLQRFAIVAITPVVIIVFSVFIDPLKPTYRVNEEKDTIVHMCYSKSNYIFTILVLVYLIILLLGTSLLAFKSKDYYTAPSSFNEPNVIAVLTYNYLIIIIILLPLRFSFPSNPTAPFLIVSITLFVFSLCSMILLFFPKFYIIFRHKHVILNLEKLIEQQESRLQDNKDKLILMKKFGDEEGNFDFTNRDIFTPDPPTPTSATSLPGGSILNDGGSDSSSRSSRRRKLKKESKYGLPDPLLSSSNGSSGGSGNASPKQVDKRSKTAKAPAPSQSYFANENQRQFSISLDEEEDDEDEIPNNTTTRSTTAGESSCSPSPSSIHRRKVKSEPSTPFL